MTEFGHRCRTGSPERERQRVFLVLMREFRNMLTGGCRGSAMGLVYSGDYQFEEAGNFGSGFVGLPDSLSNPQFVAIAKSFSDNIKRVSCLAGMPIQLIFWAAFTTQVGCSARAKLGLAPDDHSRDDDEAFAEIARELHKKQLDSVTAYAVYSIGSQNLNALLKARARLPTNPVAESLEATLAAMLTATYAALETLAADLWIEAVNQFPALARNWFEKNPDKQVPGNVLAGYDFNASGSMGRILHDTRRVSFESWYDVKKAYSQAFKGEIDEAFEPADLLLKAEKTRHLFAHRGGQIDRKFKEDMEPFPEHDELVQGERLRLTGPVVRDHIKTCVGCAVALAQRVDTWALARA